MPPNNIPGVTYSQIGTRKRISNEGRKSVFSSDRASTSPRNPTQYAQDISILQEYDNIARSLEERESAKKEKTPAWQKLGKAALTGLQYTSGSELATKIPGIGDEIEAGLDYVPGVRTALAVATNPLTYATGGVGAGLAAAAGAGIGAYALSDRERGLGLDLPGVSERWEETLGGAAGGLAGGFAGARFRRIQAGQAVKNAEQQVARINAGKLQPDDVLYTADRGRTFTANQPTFSDGTGPGWHTVRIKNSQRYIYNPDDMSYSLAPEDTNALARLSANRSAQKASEGRTLNLAEEVDGNDLFDVLSSPAEKRSAMGRLGDAAQGFVERVPEPVPGFRRIYSTARRADRGVGQLAASAVPDFAKPVVGAMARPSVVATGWALANPDKVKDAIKKAFEIDHAVGLKVAETVLPNWEIDVDVPDWLPVAGDTVELDVEGIGAELFRPTNLINFTPAGAGVRGAMVARAGMRAAGAKALGEIAIREGAGNAVFAGMDAWARGADKEGILLSMGMGFAAGAALGVPMNVAMPIASHHLGPLMQMVRRAPDGQEPRVLMTANKHLQAEAPQAPQAPQAERAMNLAEARRLPSELEDLEFEEFELNPETPVDPRIRPIRPESRAELQEMGEFERAADILRAQKTENPDAQRIARTLNEMSDEEFSALLFENFDRMDFNGLRNAWQELNVKENLNTIEQGELQYIENIIVNRYGEDTLEGMRQGRLDIDEEVSTRGRYIADVGEPRNFGELRTRRRALLKDFNASQERIDVLREEFNSLDSSIPEQAIRRNEIMTEGGLLSKEIEFQDVTAKELADVERELRQPDLKDMGRRTMKAEKYNLLGEEPNAGLERNRIQNELDRLDRELENVHNRLVEAERAGDAELISRWEQRQNDFLDARERQEGVLRKYGEVNKADRQRYRDIDRELYERGGVTTPETTSGSREFYADRDPGYSGEFSLRSSDNLEIVDTPEPGDLPMHRAFWIDPQGRLYYDPNYRSTHWNLLTDMGMGDSSFERNLHNGWLRGYYDENGLDIMGQSREVLGRAARLVPPNTTVYAETGIHSGDIVLGGMRGELNRNAKNADMYDTQEITTAGKLTPEAGSAARLESVQQEIADLEARIAETQQRYNAAEYAEDVRLERAQIDDYQERLRILRNEEAYLQSDIEGTKPPTNRERAAEWRSNLEKKVEGTDTELDAEGKPFLTRVVRGIDDREYTVRDDAATTARDYLRELNRERSRRGEAEIRENLPEEPMGNAPELNARVEQLSNEISDIVEQRRVIEQRMIDEEQALRTLETPLEEIDAKIGPMQQENSRLYALQRELVRERASVENQAYAAEQFAADPQAAATPGMFGDELRDVAERQFEERITAAAAQPGMERAGNYVIRTEGMAPEMRERAKKWYTHGAEVIDDAGNAATDMEPGRTLFRPNYDESADVWEIGTDQLPYFLKDNGITLEDIDIIAQTPADPYAPPSTGDMARIQRENYEQWDIETRAESMAISKAIEDNGRVVGDHVVTSMDEAHGPVLDKLAGPISKTWHEGSQEILDIVKEVIRRSGFSMPQGLDTLTHGGILLNRQITGEKGYQYTLGQFALDGAENGFIFTDPLSQYQNAMSLIMGARKLNPEDKAVLDRIFPPSYNKKDDLLGHMAVGWVANMFHEASHLIATGHENDFWMVLDNIRANSGADFDRAVDLAHTRLEGLAKTGQMAKIQELTKDARRIDLGARESAGTVTEATRRPVAADNVLEPDARITEAAAESAGGVGVPRPVEEGRSVTGRGVEGGPESTTEAPRATGGAGDSGDGGTGGSGPTDLTPEEPTPPKKSRKAKVNRVGPAAQRLDKKGKVSEKPLKAEQTVAATQKPKPLPDTEDYEVIGDSWDTNLNGAKLEEAGPGAAFLRIGRDVRKAQKKGQTIVQPLSEIDDIVEANFKGNFMKKLAEKFPRFGKWIGGLAAIAKEPWEKAIAAGHILMEEGNSRTYLTMKWLRQEKLPFNELRSKADGAPTGKILLTTKKGKEVTVSLGDVISNPSQYKLTPSQKSFINITHKIIDDVVEEMKANGINIKELGIEKRGEHYFPRMVKGKDGFLLEDILGYDKPYASKMPGAKQRFQKTRQYGSEAAGEAGGVVYAPAMEALEGFIHAANLQIVHKKVLNSLDKYGVTAKDLALEQIGYVTIPGKNGRPDRKIPKNVYGASAEVRKAQKEVRRLEKALARARRGKVVVGVTKKGAPAQRTIEPERKLSAREITSMVNEDEDIIRLRKAIDDAKAAAKHKDFKPDYTSEEKAAIKAWRTAKAQYKSLLRRAPQDAITYTERGKPVVTRISREGKVSGTTDEFAKTVSREQLEDAAKRVEETRTEAGKIFKKHNQENLEILGDTLAETMAKKRAEMRLGHEIGRGAQVSVKRQNIADIRAQLDAARTELIDRKFHLRHEADNFRATVERKANSITEETDLLDEDVVNELGLEGNIVAVRRAGMIPGLQGKLFPDEIADAIDAGLKNEGYDGAIKTVSDLNDKARLFKTGADVGYLFIQGLPVLATHPREWALASYNAVKALFDPKTAMRWMQSKQKVIDDMYPHAGGFTGSEYFSDAPGTNFIKKWAQTHVDRGPGLPISAGKRGAGEVLARAAVSFEFFLDAAKVLMWEANVHNKGFDRTTKESFGRLYRNLTGTTSTSRLGISKRQRQLEALLMFSPRFTRSIFANIAQAIEPGPARAEAIKGLGLMMAAGFMLYAGTKTALYESGVIDEPFAPEDLDPRNGGRFMSVKIGNNYYGIGGSMRGALQLAAGVTSAAIDDPTRLASLETTGSEANPFLRFMRGKSSPAVGSALDLATGKTVIGEDVSDRKAYLARLPDAYVPFVINSFMETDGGIAEKMGGAAGQAAGLRTFPESAGEDLDRAVQKYANDKSVDGWRSLTSSQKIEMLNKHPELQKLLNKKDVSQWNDLKEIELEYQKRKKELGARWLKTQAQGGVKMVSDDLTSEEYREELRSMNAQLAAAKGAIIGDHEFDGPADTPRQKLMKAYYEYVNRDLYTRPDGTVDWDAKDKLEADFLAQLDETERNIIAEETSGTAKADPVERRYKESYQKLRPYFDLSDAVAQQMGYANALEASLAPENTVKKYNKKVDAVKEKWRKQNPELDELLKIWGYVSKTLDEQDTGGSKFKNPYQVRRSKLEKRVTSGYKLYGK